MSFFSKLNSALINTASFFEKMEKDSQERAFNDGYNDYMNGRIKGLISSRSCGYSDSMLLNQLYKNGAYKAQSEKYAHVRPIEDTITYRDKNGNITGTKTRTRR